jgi:hypothetical protein
MALRKSISWHGITADYWKITSTLEDFRNNRTIVKVDLYANSEARNESVMNFFPKAQRIYVLDGVDMDRQQRYDLIKLKPEFQNCEDC